MNVVVINLCRPPCSFWTNEPVSVCWDAFLKPYLYERCHTTHATYCTSLHIDIHINSCLLVMHVHIITYLKRVFDHCSHTQNTHKYTLHIDAQVVILSIFKDGNLKSVISDCWPVHCQALIVCLLPQEPRPVEGGWESTPLAHGKMKTDIWLNARDAGAPATPLWWHQDDLQSCRWWHKCTNRRQSAEDKQPAVQRMDALFLLWRF